MGYYTSREIRVETKSKKKDREKEIIKHLREEYEEARYAIDEDGQSIGNTKWYTDIEDLVEFSKKYPTELFIMWGEGEESYDLWKSYIKNGKFHTVSAKITYPDYDERKLKAIGDY